MAERIGDNKDLIVDEMKRKARRRLVGAIVLASAAAIIVPMLLENEPRPLGDEVSVQIPPVDEGKFVNRLTGKADTAKPLAKADEKTQPKTAAPKPEPARTEAAVKLDAAPETREAVVASSASAPAAPPSSAETQPRGDQAKSNERAPAPPPQTAAPGSDVKSAVPEQAPSEPKPLVAESKSPGIEAPAKSTGFVVQLAAFADDKGANSLANKLKRAGYTAYVEAVQTSRGTLWRVRVGEYPSRSEADAARAKLKVEGYSGIVAPAT